MMNMSGNSMGENIYASWGYKFNATRIVGNWYSEIKDFTYGPFSMPAVGHYTQVNHPYI